MTDRLPANFADAPDEVVKAWNSLNGNQRKFALALPLCRTMEEAALQAGYAKATARKLASTMAKKPAIKTITDWCARQAIKASVLNLDRLQEEIAAIAHADPRQLFNENGTLKNLAEIDANTARAISGFEFADGEVTKRKITLWNKLDAIEKALKLLNAYPEQKKDNTPPAATIVGVIVVPEKGQYRHPERPVLEGVAAEIQRTEPAPAGKPFKLTGV